jgi:site-specific recombinase XerD
MKNQLHISTEDLTNLEKLVTNLLRKNRPTKKLKYQNLSIEQVQSKLIPIWLSWVRTGKLGGRLAGPRMIEIYDYYFNYFLNLLPKRSKPPIVSADNFRYIIGKIPVEKFSTRNNVYGALMSVSKFLIEHDEFTTEERSKLKELKPRRFFPPKRPCINEEQLNKVIEYLNQSREGSDYDRLLSKTLIIFIANTGLRAFEVANLTIQDVDLPSRVVSVINCKGRKNRKVGISQSLYQILCEYQKNRLLKFRNRKNFFLNRNGTPMNRDTIHQKIERVANNFDFHFSLHSLRRAFVSINVAKGRHLVYLQIACGHADITTTRSYCQTSQDEVLEAMKCWD